MLIFYDSLARTSYVKMIDVWLIFCLLIPLAEVLFHAVLDKYRDDRTKRLDIGCVNRAPDVRCGITQPVCQAFLAISVQIRHRARGGRAPAPGQDGSKICHHSEGESEKEEGNSRLPTNLGNGWVSLFLHFLCPRFLLHWNCILIIDGSLRMLSDKVNREIYVRLQISSISLPDTIRTVEPIKKHKMDLIKGNPWRK